MSSQSEWNRSVPIGELQLVALKTDLVDEGAEFADVDAEGLLLGIGLQMGPTGFLRNEEILRFVFVRVFWICSR